MRHLISAISGVPGGRRSSRKAAAKQGGYIIIALAIVGLFGGAVVAAPIVERAVSSLSAHNATDAGEKNGARSAAEHAIWRIRNEPAFVDSLAGDPPSGAYSLAMPDGSTADVTVEASSVTPPNEGIQVYLTASPEVMAPDTPTVLTYTLTVVNYDHTTHSVNRVTVDPLLFDPVYIAGSTSGMTTGAPTCTVLSGCRWNLSPDITLAAYGGEASLSFQMTADQPAGTLWTQGSARIVGYGTVFAPLTARSRFMDLDTLSISTVVAPAEAYSDESQEFQYDVTVVNGGGSPVTIEWLAHYSHPYFAYVNGSSEGLSTDDPDIIFDWVNNRNYHVWTLTPTVLDPGQQTTLRFRMQGSLEAGIYYSTSEVKVTEDGNGYFPLSTLTTGDSAPVISWRKFAVTAVNNNITVQAEVVPQPGGVTVIEWTES